MARTPLSFPKTYAKCEQFLDGRPGRTVQGIKSTGIEKNRDGTISILYHGTSVVLHHPDGTTTVNTGGWSTTTTKKRINDFCHATVWQKDGVWYIQTSGTDAVQFKDGYTFKNRK